MLARGDGDGAADRELVRPALLLFLSARVWRLRLRDADSDSNEIGMQKRRCRAEAQLASASQPRSDRRPRLSNGSRPRSEATGTAELPMDTNNT